jgi:hypothetical protein
MGPASILGKVEIENVTIPPGDRGEQLIANLILSTIAFDLDSDVIARKHFIQAHMLAIELADQSLVYHPPRPSPFARLTCELDGHAETILLPVINNILVLPALTAEDLAGDRQAAAAPAVNVTVVELTRFMLRLRPRRIASILESLGSTAPSQQLTDAARRILSACTRHELPAGDPLDRASDCFTLAHNFIGKQNFALARLALSNADRALDEHVRIGAPDSHAAAIQGMRDRISRMLAELRQSAM